MTVIRSSSLRCIPLVLFAVVMAWAASAWAQSCRIVQVVQILTEELDFYDLGTNPVQSLPAKKVRLPFIAKECEGDDHYYAVETKDGVMLISKIQVRTSGEKVSCYCPSRGDSALKDIGAPAAGELPQCPQSQCR